MSIVIKNCSTNNLKNVSLEIPFNKITCVTGPSGSGKSSLVFHTLANESKRRFLNSLPSSVTFFDRVPQSADVEVIAPVLPVWILPQNNPIAGSRLNLLDQLELTMDLAQLYFDDDSNICPLHEVELSDGYDLFKVKLESLTDNDNEVIHLFIDKEIYSENISGYPVRSYDGDSSNVVDFDEGHQYWELFRIKKKGLSKLQKKLDDFPFLRNNPVLLLAHIEGHDPEYIKLTKDKVCLTCLEEEVSAPRSVDELIPFNGVGACSTCKGYGSILEYSKAKLAKYPGNSIEEGAVSILSYSKFKYYEPYFVKELKKKKISTKLPFVEVAEEVWPILLNGSGDFPGVLEMFSWLEEKRYKRSVRIFLRGIQVDLKCPDCDGVRVSPTACSYKSVEMDLPTYGEILNYKIEKIYETLKEIKSAKKKVILDRILSKLDLAIELGLGSFKVTKKLKELETNEYQKSLLVRYLSYQGSGSLFVLDEPSLGLDLDEQKVLVKYLKSLSKNNTLVLVDHSQFVQRNSDLIVEVGPGAGHLGGEINYIGKFRAKKESKIEHHEVPPKPKGKVVLKNIVYEDKKIKKIEIPQNTVSTVDSYLESFSKRVMSDVVANDLYMRHFGEKLNYDVDYNLGAYNKYSEFDNIIVYKTSVERASGRSTVGTMLGLTPYVRKYFAGLPVSKNLGLKDGHFSPNSDLGKCQVCEGKGVREIDMQFLEDVSYPCDECEGKKLNKFYANITDGKITVHQAYNMPIGELFAHIPSTPKVKRIMEYLKILNLDYLTLDRDLPSLSGGERLRIKFLNTLQKNIENSFLVFTSLSYGLSQRELVHIRDLMIGLCAKGNTIVLVDNHPIFKDFNKIEIPVEDIN